MSKNTSPSRGRRQKAETVLLRDGQEFVAVCAGRSVFKLKACLLTKALQRAIANRDLQL